MSSLRTAADLNVIACHSCGQVLRFEHRHEGAACPRCSASVHRRKPASFTRTWALLIAAAILYVPANLLPIMRTASLGDVDDDTILSGVIRLWQNGSYDLATIVFVASIMVPVVKIVVLAVLLITTQRGSRWRQRQRSQLYRLIEFIGHWSMLDIFVVALLAALVHFKTLADVTPGPGAVAFGAVVVLTMMASKTFDPRLIWDIPDA
jgi:paraquat-inducible protein A